MVHYYTCGATAGLISMMEVKEAAAGPSRLVALHTVCLGEVAL